MKSTFSNVYQAGKVKRDAVVIVTSDSGEIGNGFFINKSFNIICPASLVYRSKSVTVSVSNVNGARKSFTYIAGIEGADYFGNLCMLRILTCDENKVNPPLDPLHHPFLKFGRSKEVFENNGLVLIGNFVKGSREISNTIIFPCLIVDKVYASSNCCIPTELMMLNGVSPKYLHGCAVLNRSGDIIGMQIQSKEPLVSVITEYAMRRPIKSFKDPIAYSKHVEIIDNVMIYKKSMLGISAEIASQFDVHKSRASKSDASVSVDVLELPKLPNEIIGYLVKDVLLTSPLHGILEQGDIITHINNIALGMRQHQTSIGCVLWSIYPGKKTTITYTRGTSICKIDDVVTMECTSEYDIPFTMSRDIMLGQHCRKYYV